MIKCITLWQPWATLMVLGLKKNETRSWQTDFRGLLGIHAAASEPAWVKKEVGSNDVFQRVFAEHGLDFKSLPRGKILGSVKVIGMMPTTTWVIKYADSLLMPTPDEWYFGDYSKGRWAWLTESPLHFNDPVPAKGAQGFWNYDYPHLNSEPTIKSVTDGQLSLFR